MKTLIGALLAVTALSPTLANAQRFGMEAGAQVDREDGPARDGPGARPRGASDGQGVRPRGAADGRVDAARFAGGDDRPDRRPDADRPDRRGGDGRDAFRPDGRQPDRFPASRGPDRPDNRAGGGDRVDRRPGNAPRGYGDPRGRDDRTRGRLDRRDDDWTRSRFADRGQWNRGWRGNDRYDWSGYRNANRGAYRLPRYYAPGGGGYRRVAIGVGLQASLWNRNYWIDDPYAYRLPEAYGPYRWVRYYGDALLVDLNSGRVVDAVYGIFW